MQNIIIANWKMNPTTKQEAKEIFEGIKSGLEGVETEVVICPPYLYLSELSGLTIGVQNINAEDNGAYTGEISAVMLKEFGVDYIIIGHSERRKYFVETNQIINKKIKKALELGFKVIFCIGETEGERKSGLKNEVLEEQLAQGLDGVESTENITIAYEPVWAIGTGDNCSVKETKESIDHIKKLIGKEIRVIYGGSANAENAESYIKEAGANGLLVGGASLKPEEFVKIIKSAE